MLAWRTDSLKKSTYVRRRDLVGWVSVPYDRLVMGETNIDGAGMPPVARPKAPSSAILTAPNAISFARLLLTPVCLLLLAQGRYVLGLWITAVVGASDILDGWLARRTGQVSRFGQLLDPFADRLLLASIAIALAMRGVLPWFILALVIARDLVLLVGFPLLVRCGVRPPEVIWLGKATSIAVFAALLGLVLGVLHFPLHHFMHAAASVLIWPAMAGYYVVGAIYLTKALAALSAARVGLLR